MAAAPSPMTYVVIVPARLMPLRAGRVIAFQPVGHVNACPDASESGMIGLSLLKIYEIPWNRGKGPTP